MKELVRKATDVTEIGSRAGSSSQTGRTTKDLSLLVETAERIIRETPIVELEETDIHLSTKLEFYNGIGSIKDRPAFWALKKAIGRGEIGPHTTIVESSSGNFACALAAFCNILELQFIPVIDPIISPIYEASLRSLCTKVVKVDLPDDTGGYLKTRLNVVRQLIADIPDSFWPNQYENTDMMEAHFNLTGAEICRQAPPFDYVFLGVGSAGTIAGVSQRLKQEQPNVKIIAVDAEGSAIFGQTPKRRSIPGLGSSISPPLLRHAIYDELMFISEPETIVGCHELLSKHGIFAGGSSGTVFSAVRKYFKNRKFAVRPRVLFLCYDRGNAYLHTVYNAQWIARQLALTDVRAREDRFYE
jgi:cysteine synthase A